MKMTVFWDTVTRSFDVLIATIIKATIRIQISSYSSQLDPETLEDSNML